MILIKPSGKIASAENLKELEAILSPGMSLTVEDRAGKLTYLGSIGKPKRMEFGFSDGQLVISYLVRKEDIDFSEGVAAVFREFSAAVYVSSQGREYTRRLNLINGNGRQR